MLFFTCQSTNQSVSQPINQRHRPRSCPPASLASTAPCRSSPVSQSTNQSVSQLVSQQINQWHRPRSCLPASSSASPAPRCSSPAGQSTNQSVSQPVSQSLMQSVNQSVSYIGPGFAHPFLLQHHKHLVTLVKDNQSTNLSVSQLINQSVGQWIRTRSCQAPHHFSPASQPSNQLNQSIYHSTNQQINQWIIISVN